MSTPPMCKAENTSKARQMFTQPKTGRTIEWQEELFGILPLACFKSKDSGIIHGPDGFPYFELYLPEDGYAGDVYCIEGILDYVLHNGYGISIHQTEGSAEWVLTYGDILNYKLNGRFYSLPETDPAPDYIVSNEHQQMMIAQPSETFLPTYMRPILKSFLQYIGIAEPKMLGILLSTDKSQQPQLAFNIFPEDYNSKEELDYKMYQLSWFFPKHYVIVGFSKNDKIAEALVVI
ncbi:MAG: hypothetical protein J5I59_12430 [Saprospiraceae bacterium]|nr:hypothetical protein [Saprospiraceae bacterium]